MPKLFSTLLETKPFLSAIFALLLGASLPTQAEIYKWVDDNGNTHYSDIKPNQKNSERLKIKTGSYQKETRDPVAASQELTDQQQSQLEAKAEKLQKETEKRQLDAQCEAIKANLKTIEENSRIKITENNETRFLTSEEIEQRKAKYRQDLKDFCTAPE
jgi:hypothetical protein